MSSVFGRGSGSVVVEAAVDIVFRSVADRAEPREQREQVNG